MDSKIKILISGDAEGKFNSLFSKVEAINKKAGPFELLLCVGNFFGVNNTEFEPYKNGFKKIPIPTYILGSNKKDLISYYPSDESEICPNLNYLGKRGLFTTSSGLKIAYVSGISCNDNPADHNFTAEDAVDLQTICNRGNGSFRGVDVLVTSQWPNYITRNTKKVMDIPTSSDEVSWLSMQLKPRYHVSGLEGVFYERPPYRNVDQSDLALATRFIALARVANPKKEKWLYALSLTPVDKMKVAELLQKTVDETPSPYNLEELEAIVFKKKRKVAEPQYFFDMSTSHEEGHQKKFKRQKITFDQNKCWFCLASPSVEKHLVLTVGTDVYIALAKGGLVDEHFLICPIEHHQSSVVLNDDVLEEIDKFKTALRSFYKRNDQVGIFFERNYKTSHMQIQCIPIPINAAKQLKEILKEEALGNGFELSEMETFNRLNQVFKVGVTYLAIELPNGEILYTKMDHKTRCPLDFVREVLASSTLLNLPDKIDWRECVRGKEDEEKLVMRLRNEFESFDISNE